MADVSSILVNHNLDFTSFEKLAIDFEKRTGSPVLISRYHTDLTYYPFLPLKYNGWLRVLYDHDELPIPAERIFTLFKHKTQDYIIIGDKRLDMAGIGIDRLHEWSSVSTYIENYSKGIKNDTLWMLHAKIERDYIYQQVKRFGGNECIMFNGERHDFLKEMLLAGIPLGEAVILSLHKFKILKFHELDPLKNYKDSPDWSDTIIFDDFRDLKLNEK